MHPHTHTFYLQTSRIDAVHASGAFVRALVASADLPTAPDCLATIQRQQDASCPPDGCSHSGSTPLPVPAAFDVIVASSRPHPLTVMIASTAGTAVATCADVPAQKLAPHPASEATPAPRNNLADAFLVDIVPARTTSAPDPAPAALSDSDDDANGNLAPLGPSGSSFFGPGGAGASPAPGGFGARSRPVEHQLGGVSGRESEAEERGLGRGSDRARLAAGPVCRPARCPGADDEEMARIASALPPAWYATAEAQERRRVLACGCSACLRAMLSCCRAAAAKHVRVAVMCKVCGAFFFAVQCPRIYRLFLIEDPLLQC